MYRYIPEILGYKKPIEYCNNYSSQSIIVTGFLAKLNYYETKQYNFI